MQLEIDPASEVPLYQQLRDRVVEGIADGRLKPGDRLTPVRQLASQFGINIATVGRGYDLLKAEGLTRTNRTSGSVIARGPRSAASAADGGTWESAARLDWSKRLTTVLAEAVAQGDAEADVQRTVSDILKTFAAVPIDAPPPTGQKGPQ